MIRTIKLNKTITILIYVSMEHSLHPFLLDPDEDIP